MHGWRREVAGSYKWIADILDTPAPSIAIIVIVKSEIELDAFEPDMTMIASVKRAVCAF